MILTDYTEAAEFVRNNKGWLWDGWSIVKETQNDYAEYLASGRFDRPTGKWYQRDVFPLDADGWVIPDIHIRPGRK